MNEQPIPANSQTETAHPVVIGGKAPHKWLKIITSADVLLTEPLPERKTIIEGFLSSQTLTMIYAQRGVGKTRFVLSMCVAIAGGTEFLGLKVPEARRVLYVDGELPLIDLRQIVIDFSGNEPPVNLHLLPSEKFFISNDRRLNIAESKDQEEFLKLLDAMTAEGKKPDVIVFDNLSSLTNGVEESDNADQDKYLHFFTNLRHSGYAVIFIHHAGKNNDQRGASRREDFCDLSIRLTPIRTADRSASFKLDLTKTRGKVFIRESKYRLVKDAKAILRWIITDNEKNNEKKETKDDELEMMFTILSNKPKTQAEIIKSTGLDKSYVSRIVAKLRQREWLEEESLTITDDGMKALENVSEGLNSSLTDAFSIANETDVKAREFVRSFIQKQ